MYSSLLWCIGGIVGGAIVSFFISLFFYKKGLTKKQIVYKIETSCIISDKINEITDLEINYHCKKIEFLYLSTITIKNTGNSIIEHQDFVFTPFLLTDDEFIINDIHNSNLIYLNDIDDLKITYNHDDKIDKINLKINYISKKGKVTLSFFHTGNNINFNAKLKDGKIIQIPNLTKLEETFLYGNITDSFIATILLIIMIIFYLYNGDFQSAILFIFAIPFCTIGPIIRYFNYKKRK